MSAFLGPIHYWLFEKIKIQDEFVTQILNYAKEKQINDNLLETLDQRIGFIEERPLEEMIDTTNIHGWLQEKVSLVEKRLAYGVTEILKSTPERIEDLENIMFMYGRSLNRLKKDATAEEVYKLLNDILLDGMPCDHINQIVSNEEKEIVWKRNRCIHQSYWEEVSSDVKYYYVLRDAFVRGLIEETNIAYERYLDIYCKLVEK